MSTPSTQTTPVRTRMYHRAVLSGLARSAGQHRETMSRAAAIRWLISATDPGAVPRGGAGKHINVCVGTRTALIRSLDKNLVVSVADRTVVSDQINAIKWALDEIGYNPAMTGPTQPLAKDQQ